jgi:hypothetical protein
LLIKKTKKLLWNIYKSWQTSLIGIFLSLGGGYLFHNATPDYIVYQYFLLGVALLFFPDDILHNWNLFFLKIKHTIICF